MPNAKTSAERVADSEAKKKEKGLRKLWLWAYPESAKRIRRYAKLLEGKYWDTDHDYICGYKMLPLGHEGAS